MNAAPKQNRAKGVINNNIYNIYRRSLRFTVYGSDHSKWQCKLSKTQNFGIDIDLYRNFKIFGLNLIILKHWE